MVEPGRDVIIIANGEQPEKPILEQFLGSRPILVCADGALRHFHRLQLEPDFFIGDCDSTEAEQISRLPDTCTVVQIRRQNDTDLEKCLKYVEEFAPAAVSIFGAEGLRFDHTLNNVALLLRYAAKYRLRMVTNHSVVEPVTGTYRFAAVSGELISIYGIDAKTKVTTSGLSYPMKNAALPFGVMESTSNRAAADEVEIAVRGGTALLVREVKNWLLLHGNGGVA